MTFSRVYKLSAGRFAPFAPGVPWNIAGTHQERNLSLCWGGVGGFLNSLISAQIDKVTAARTRG